MLNVELVLPGS